MDAPPSQELPPGWAVASLGDLIDGIEAGKNVAASGRPPEDGETGIVKVSAVTWGEFDEDESKALHPGTEVDPADLIRPGDFLISRANTIELVGAPVIVKQFRRRLVLSDKVLRLRVVEGFDRWLELFLKSHFGRAQIEQYATGAQLSMRNISQENLRRIAVPVAPRDEQARIVAAVNTLFEDVEAGEAALERAREGLTQFRASLLHTACTGALTARCRAENPTNETGHDLLADVLAKRRLKWAASYRAAAEARGRRLDGEAWLARYPQPQPVTTDNLEPLPHGWTWASLDELCVTMTSGSRAWAPYYDRGTSVFVMAQNVRPSRFDRSYVQLVDPPADDPERLRTRIQRDDLLVTIVGANTGDVCRVDADVVDHYVCQSVALMRPVRADLAEYLDLFLNSERGGQAAFTRMMYGAGRPHLSFDQLKSVAVPLPPLAEIAAILDAVRDARIEAEALMPEGFASSLRQSILHAAFTGRLVPQDPADEPAAALLVRLSAAPASSRRTRARRAATQPDLIETQA